MNLIGHDLLGLMASHGYLLLFAIILLEEAGVPIPIPGDILLLLTGSLIAKGTLGFAPAFLIISLATVLGTSILYTLAFRGGRPLLRRYGRWLRLKEERVDRAARWLNRRPLSGVALLRLTPGLRIYSTLVSGLLAVPRPKATISFMLSGMIWSAAWLGTGMLLGPNVDRAVSAIRRIDGMVLPLLALIAVSLGLFWLIRRIDRSNLSSQVARLLAISPRPNRPTVRAIALALLLVVPPVLGTAESVGERVEAGTSVYLTMTRERPSLTITRYRQTQPTIASTAHFSGSVAT